MTQPPYAQPVNFSDPYTPQAISMQNSYAGDGFNAWGSMQQSYQNMMGLQNQQQQLLGNGGYGYTAGGGNGGAGYYNPWTSMQVSNYGQGGNPNLPSFNPNSKNLTQPGYATSGYSDVLSNQRVNTQGLTPGQLSNNDPASLMSTINTNNQAQSQAGNVAPLSGGGGGYPTYPNSAGVGSQTAGQPAPSGLNLQNQPAAPTGPMQTKDQAPANTTQGFNPWSLTGEANSRVM